ncbi:putative transcription factor kapC [Paramyrothecium foliicola]|nr:putative transcription factor kapC [Paramyrothecium foliicola]
MDCTHVSSRFFFQVSQRAVPRHLNAESDPFPQTRRAMQPTTSTGASSQDQHLRAQLELLKDHDPEPSSASAASSSRESAGPPNHAPQQPPPPPASNGYDPVSLASQDVVRALASKHEVDAHIHPDLRARPSPGHAPSTNMMPIAAPSSHSPGSSVPGPSNPNIAPAPSVTSPMEDVTNDGRKAKRELSQSKRAAQNRAAQRAFRQRKEGYIKKLEQQVREFLEMEQAYKTLQAEDYALREYVIHLQSRLLDAQGEVPQPPPNVNLSQPPPPVSAPQTNSQEPVPNSAGVGTPLEAVAQAVAGLAAQEQLAERQQYASAAYKSPQGAEDTRTADEINRQLQPDEGVGQASGV